MEQQVVDMNLLAHYKDLYSGHKILYVRFLDNDFIFRSLTRKEYPPRERPLKEQPPRNETPEEMEARIRAEILAESKGGKEVKDKNIHNLNYQEEKEPMNVVDILLTIVLIIVILIVIYYLIYVFTLNATYPTFMDAVYALSNPQNVINSMLNPPAQVWNLFMLDFFF